jgi:hypothetical protein
MTSIKTLQNAKRNDLLGKTITVDGDTFIISNVGFTVEGKIYLHLSSTTRFRQQRNGKCPVQAADWFDLEEIEAQTNPLENFNYVGSRHHY